VRPCGAGRKRGVEFQLEARIDGQAALGDPEHVDPVVALRVHLSCLVLVREVAARNGYPCASHFERDEFLDPLRGTEGFERLLNEVRAESQGYARLYAELLATREGDGDGVVPDGPGIKIPTAKPGPA
jgi:hypothetical protein